MHPSFQIFIYSQIKKFLNAMSIIEYKKINNVSVVYFGQDCQLQIKQLSITMRFQEISKINHGVRIILVGIS